MLGNERSSLSVLGILDIIDILIIRLLFGQYLFICFRKYPLVCMMCIISAIFILIANQFFIIFYYFLFSIKTIKNKLAVRKNIF